jgi:hypothetical protein
MFLRSNLMISGSALTFAIFANAGVLQAADVDVPKTDFCAVSAPNGKINVNGGYVNNTTNGSSASLGVNGSISMPVGCSFGLQFDAGIQNQWNDTTFGGAVHAFTRDPNSYLAGVTGGYFANNGSNIWAVGPEFELYADRFSFEAWGGLANVNVGGVVSNNAFVLAEIAYYPVDDLRMSLGTTIVGAAKFARAEMEYQVSGPISAKLDAKIGDDNFVGINAGLTFYFGGDTSKSLIRRHREDDPRNRMVDFNGVNNSLTNSSIPVGCPIGYADFGSGCDAPGNPT